VLSPWTNRGAGHLQFMLSGTGKLLRSGGTASRVSCGS
jgi:hypothetical protein